MPAHNTPTSYGSVAKTFHWLTALLLISVFLLGLLASDLSQSILEGQSDGSQDTIDKAVRLFSLHKTLGLTIFAVALARILWAMSQPKPGLLHPENKPEALAAETVHWLLYGAMLLAPLTGWIHHAATTGFAPIWWPFGQGLPFVPKSEPLAESFAILHWIATHTLLAAFLLHVAGALKHAIIDRDATLQRMLPGNRDLPQPPKQEHSALPAVLAVLLWAGALGGGSLLFSDSHDQGPPSVSANAETANPQASGSGFSPNWEVSEGILSITIQQMGSAVTGQFDDWSARIQFDDPATPGPAGQVEVEINISSLSLGTVTAQAMGPDYFDSETYPKARFEAEIEKLETGYQAVGNLTLRGKTLPLTLPFELQLEEDRAEMRGGATVNRMDFDIGLGTKDEGSLGFEVRIDVALKAGRIID